MRSASTSRASSRRRAPARHAARSTATDADIIRLFYQTKSHATSARNFKRAVIGRHAVQRSTQTRTPARSSSTRWSSISEDAAERLKQSGVESVEVIANVDDPLILNTLREDTTESHEEALLKIYGRLRPGNPPQVEKAKELFREKFFDESRYRLGKVGRFRLNRKFGTNFPEEQQTLQREDLLVQAVRYAAQAARRQG